MKDRGASHRKPDMPFWDVPKGRCRWCGDFIWNEDEQLNLRKHWHEHCVDAYKEAAWPTYARKKVYHRDKGICAVCRKSCKRSWELDHITPLIDGGDFDLTNMQTLCPACHKAKTSREASSRSVKRRTQQPVPEIFPLPETLFSDDDSLP